MPHTRKLMLAVVALLVLSAAQSVHADPFTFSNVRAAQTVPNDPLATTVFTDLFSNPGVVLTNGTRVAFLVDLKGPFPFASSDTLRFSIFLPDGTTIVDDVKFNSPGGGTTTLVLGSGFIAPVYYQPRTFTLVVDLLGSNPDFVIPSGPNAGQRVNSYTYTFSVVQPAPEPATVLLLATGLGGVAAGARRRRRRRV